MPLKVLHTSDWHLGRSLYGQKRYEEFDALLDWMIATLQDQQIDVLLIAGDVFDTTAPSNRATQQYYNFLHRVSGTCCRHVIVIGGNHDSPTFLNAPRELLKVLNVHVVGAKTDSPADEVIVLNQDDGKPALIVCAVPYLRDRDIRTAEAGETISDKEQKLLDGIREHYAAVTEAGQALRELLEVEHNTQIPMIGMGHLWAAGARTVEDDGVRELYVGSLAHVGSDIFPDALDYVALGHLHVPQAVNEQEDIRYSGSPLPMGFGEAMQQKSVCVLEFQSRKPRLELLPIPVFQRLRQLRGNLSGLQTDLQALMEDDISTWVEVIYSGEDIVSDLREQLIETVSDSEGQITLLRVKNQRISQQTLQAQDNGQTLDDLTPLDVFQQCLAAHAIPDEQQSELLHLYQTILAAVQEADSGAE